MLDKVTLMEMIHLEDLETRPERGHTLTQGQETEKRRILKKMSFVNGDKIALGYWSKWRHLRNGRLFPREFHAFWGDPERDVEALKQKALS